MTADALAVPFVLLATDDDARVGRSRPGAEDREAIEACQRGDRAAFDRLVERYQRDVYRLCYRYVNNHHDASDLAQESFLKAYRAIGRFRGDSAFSTWLYRIAVNTCLNFRATRKLPSESLEDDVADGARGISDRLEQDELSERVREAVSRLPEKQRATLILKIYHDLTHEEVAKILGSTVGTVKANLFHALGNLRKTMGAAAKTAGAARTDGPARASGSKTGE
jgi:RNA polymerase sigma-70 factor (ECF subfamily)